MTTAHVVETSVTVNNNSPIQDYVHPDDQTQPTYEIVFCRISHNLHIQSDKGPERVQFWEHTVIPMMQELYME